MAPGGGQRQRDSKQGRLVAVADAGVGTAAALLIGWRRLCGGKKEQEQLWWVFGRFPSPQSM